MKKLKICLIGLLLGLAVSATTHAGINDGLIAWYPFNGDAIDASGNRHDGTVYGGSESTSDRFNAVRNAYRFDSTDDYIDLGPEQQLFPNDSFSVAIWIKVPTVSASFGFFGIIGDYITYTDPFWGLSIADKGFLPSWGQGKLFYSLRTNTSGGTLLSSRRIDDNSWHYVVIVRDANAVKMSMYIDGVLEGASWGDGSTVNGVPVNGSTDAPVGSVWSGQHVVVARHLPSEGRYSNFSGDDVRIYNRTLSASEVQQLYQGQGTCSSEVVKFTAGTPAKAADVNANFDALNCQIQALKAIVCKNEPTASVCQ